MTQVLELRALVFRGGDKDRSGVVGDAQCRIDRSAGRERGRKSADKFVAGAVRAPDLDGLGR